jgi:hypothetical protein
MTRRAIVVAAFLGLLCPLARAQASLDALISLQDDGSAVIAERLQLPAAMTEPLRWRLRTETVTPGGIRRRLFVDLVEVSDAHEKRLSFLRRNRPEYLEVLVPRQPLGGNTVRVTYNVRNAVRFGSDHDELFWPAGDTWATPIDQLTVQLSVPDKAVGQFTARLFSGASPSRPRSMAAPPPGPRPSLHPTSPPWT